MNHPPTAAMTEADLRVPIARLTRDLVASAAQLFRAAAA